MLLQTLRYVKKRVDYYDAYKKEPNCSIMTWSLNIQMKQHDRKYENTNKRKYTYDLQYDYPVVQNCEASFAYHRRLTLQDSKHRR